MNFEPDLDKVYQQLNQRADLVYDFVIRYYSYIYANHGYGSGHEFTMMEIHTLTHIADNPGVTITELARIWCKTKSAVSQTVKKLVDQDLVVRQCKENNSKTVLLFPTDKGKGISNVHKAYDVADITQTTNHLLTHCGKADLEAFYRVLAVYTELLAEG